MVFLPMAKKTLIFVFLEICFVFLWLFFIGQFTGFTALSGDVNLLDEGQYAAWVNHMLHGQKIYKDFFLPYGPVQVYLAYFFVLLFGQTMFSIRLSISIVSIFLGIVVAIYVMRKLKIHPYLQVISTAFLLVVPGLHIRHWVGVAALILLANAIERKSNALLILVGILLSISVLQSIEVGIISCFLAFVYLTIKLYQSVGKKIIIQKILLVGVSFLIPILVWLLFSGIQGWLFDYTKTTYEAVFANAGVNLANGQGLPVIFNDSSKHPVTIVRELFSKEALFYWSLILLLIFASSLIIRFLSGNVRKEDSSVILLIGFGVMTYASIIGRSGHYFLVVPFVVISFSYLLTILFGMYSKSSMNQRILIILIFASFILYLSRHILIFRFSPLFNFNQKSFYDISVERVSPIGISKNQASEIRLLQDFIDKNTREFDSIFVINNQPGLYFLVDRANATYFDLPFLAYSRSKRLELVASIKNKKPIYIIEDTKAWSIDNVSDRQRLPEFFAYLGKNYEKYKVIKRYIIYRLKSAK